MSFQLLENMKNLHGFTIALSKMKIMPAILYILWSKTYSLQIRNYESIFSYSLRYHRRLPSQTLTPLVKNSNDWPKVKAQWPRKNLTKWNKSGISGHTDMLSRSGTEVLFKCLIKGWSWIESKNEFKIIKNKNKNIIA